LGKSSSICREISSNTVRCYLKQTHTSNGSRVEGSGPSTKIG
jgi:hypothetical protein